MKYDTHYICLYFIQGCFTYNTHYICLYFIQGCFTKLDDLFEKYNTAFIGVGVAIIVFQVITFLFISLKFVGFVSLSLLPPMF